MKILMVGAGAVGGLFGSYLHNHPGVELEWLVRPARLQQLQASGLTVVTPDHKRHFAPVLKTREQLQPGYDLIILTSKAYSLDSVIEDIRPIVSAETRILPLLNGLAHLDRLDQVFSPQQVLGGIAKTIATLADPHTVDVNNRFSSVTVGARCPEQQDFVGELSQLLVAAGVTLDDGSDIMAAMWDKFCRMSALGAANCLLQGTVGEYMRSDEGGDIALQLFAECTHTAALSGYPLADEAITGFRRAMTNPKSSFNSSMYRDLCQGLPIEGDHLVGDMLARARQHGMEAPILRVANAVLQTYQARQRP